MTKLNSCLTKLSGMFSKEERAEIEAAVGGADDARAAEYARAQVDAAQAELDGVMSQIAQAQAAKEPPAPEPEQGTLFVGGKPIGRFTFNSDRHDGRAKLEVSEVPELAGKLGEPPIVVVDRANGRALNAEEQKVIAAAIKDLLNKGLPPAMLDGVRSFYVREGYLAGEYHIEGQSIGISADVLEAAGLGNKYAISSLRGMLAHELAHHEDEDPQTNIPASVSGGPLALEDVGTTRVPRGKMMIEAFTAWRKGGEFGRLLDYPLAQYKRHTSGSPDAQMTASGYNSGDFTWMLTQEVYAQLRRLWFTNASMLRVNVPSAYAFFEEMQYEHGREGTIGGHRRAVREGLRRWRSADVGVSGVDRRRADRADGAGAPGRQAGAGVGQEQRVRPGDRAATLEHRYAAVAGRETAGTAPREDVRGAGVRDGGERPVQQAVALGGLASTPVHVRPRQPDAVTVVGVHYSARDGISQLAGNMYGSATSKYAGEEYARVQRGHPAVKRRVYFYAQQSDAVPRPEEMVTGQYVYTATLSNILHPDSETGRRLSKQARASGEFDGNAYEESVIDAGYDGYFNPYFGREGAVVVLDANIPVKSLGTKQDLRRPQKLEVREDGTEYDIGAERGERAKGRAAISASDFKKITDDGKALGLDSKQIAEFIKEARETRSRFAASKGWVPPELVGLQRNEKPGPDGMVEQLELVWKQVPYGFNRPPGAKKAPPKIDTAWADRVVEQGLKEIRALYARAKAGDKVAQNIVAHAAWYRAMTDRLRAEFGGAADFYADLLGAFSPNTPVRTNWNLAIEAIQDFSNGAFRDELQKFSDWIDSGKAPSAFPAYDKIRRQSGKLFGMNSGNGMLAMLAMWRMTQPGMAPKARNFAANLIGASNMATIDVWAARFLRRMANGAERGAFNRIPVVAEKGVTGKWDAHASKVTGEFGFGAHVLDKLSAELKKDGIDLTPPDLQAVAWFVEKELWTKEAWTSKQGEGGSFEEQSDLADLRRYMSGATIARGDWTPDDMSMAKAAARVMHSTFGDPDVVSARALPTVGMYAGSGERSFDNEITARDSWDPSRWVAEIAQMSKEAGQIDAFVSRVVRDGEDNPNARPGVEVFFKKPLDKAAISRVEKILSDSGEPGFTLTVDPREARTNKGEEPAAFSGLRIQYVPEIGLRYGDEKLAAAIQEGPEAVQRIIEERRDALDMVAAALRMDQDVAHAKVYLYDTVVFGQENYDAYTSGRPQGETGESRGAPWFGTPVHEGLASAARRYEQAQAGRDDADVLQREAAEPAEEVGDAFEGDVEDTPLEDIDFDVGDAPRRPDRLDVQAGEAPLWESGLAIAIEQKAPFAKNGKIAGGVLVKWLEARTKDGVVKKEELELSGLIDYIYTIMQPSSRDKLDESKQVDRADIESYLRANGVQVQDVMLGRDDQAKLIAAEDALIKYLVREQNFTPYGARDYALDAARGDLTDSQFAAIEDGEHARLVQELNKAYLDRNFHRGDGQTKYHDWQLPGGKNYRELLLTLPSARDEEARIKAARASMEDQRAIDDANRRALAARGKTDFHSSHFDQPNILAHVRFNERTSADGKRVLFVEEIQSDWAQKGRKEGFSEPRHIKSYKIIEDGDEYRIRWDNGDTSGTFPTQQRAWTHAEDALRSGRLVPSGVPSAPFVGKTEAWVALAMKRMIRYAADNGFDRVAWTTGEQQADRYDMSKQISRIRWDVANGSSRGSLYAYGLDGREVINRDASVEDLPDIIGKEPAQKLLDASPTRGPTRSGRESNVATREISGLDLKVGGEGMRAFYDKIVPNVANDLLKKMGGGRVTEISLGIPTGDERARLRTLGSAMQPGFELTPEMLPRAKRPQRLFINAGTMAGIQQSVSDALRTARTFNAWHKGPGTQYHKAEVDADFRPVYQGVQNFLNDSSQMMMEAADLAPDLLPKLSGFGDIFKAGPKKETLNRVSDAVFDGTIQDRVWSDAELRARGMDDREVGMYRQARRAIDRVLDEAFASEAVREARGHLPQDVLDRAKSDGNGWIVVDALSAIPQAQRTDLQQQIYDQLRKRAAAISDLQQAGYAPLMRFGQYTLTVTDANGQVLLFTMHESEREANAMARAAAADPQLAGATVTRGVLSQDAWKLFQGMSPDALEVFAEALDASEKEVYQQYLKFAVNNRSVLKRMLRRKKVEGFSTDVQRTLAQFITSTSRAAAKNYHWGDVLKAAEAIPKAKGDVKDEAVRLVEYMRGGGDDAGALRGLLFVQFLGGSVASAAVNATQPALMTFPWLSQYGGATKAAARLAAATKVALGGRPEAGLADALKLADEQGITDPHEVAGLYAESIRNFGSNLWVRRILKAWGSFFSLAEAFNRRLTFTAAYRTAVEEGIADPYTFAVRAVAETQGVYNKGNRPNWARGSVGATLMTFKQYSVSYLEFFKRLPPKEKAIALAMLVLAAGLQGVPGADDIEDVIDTLAESAGYSFNSKQAMREWAVETLGEPLGGFLVNGFSSLPGVPLDVQARLGLGNLLPGTAIFKRSQTDKSREVLEFFGPAGGQAKSLMDAFTAAQEGDPGAVGKALVPLAIRNALKGLDMAQTGWYRDERGRRVIDVDAYDSAIKTIGFQPAKVAREQRKVQDWQQSINLQKDVESRVADLWARGIMEGDPSKVERARAELLAWNQTNPDARVLIAPTQIQRRVQQMLMTREQRFIKTAPPEMRRAVVEDLRQ